MSRVSNHINRNIDHDRSSTDADIEILNLNSPSDTRDLEQHETSLNEAWHFINAARQQNFSQNECIQRNYENYNQRQSHDRNIYENVEQNYISRPSNKNIAWDKTARNRKRDLDFCFSTINEYLDELDNSSDEESPSVIQNYFNNEHGTEEEIEVYDGTIYTVSNEGPMLIYSYKSKYNSDPNEIPINSPNQESQSNSTGSISVENFNEESVSFEKTFYRISTSFHPMIIPRLPLTTCMLPTVSEILESSKQSPKVAELSDEELSNDHISAKRMPTNSWVIKGDTSQSYSNNDSTVETKVNNSDESLPAKEQSLKSLNVELEIRTNIDVQENTRNCDKKAIIELHSTEISTGESTKNTYYEKEILKQRNNYLNTDDSIVVDSTSDHFEKQSRKSMHRNSFPMELLFKRSSIKKHLYLIKKTDAKKKSWFKRFIKYISCCK